MGFYILRDAENALMGKSWKEFGTLGECQDVANEHDVIIESKATYKIQTSKKIKLVKIEED